MDGHHSLHCHLQSATMRVFLFISMWVAVAITASVPQGDPSAPVHTAPAPYSFAWGVKDAASSNLYNHQETSNGKTVQGSYQVLLSDGRIQTVNYKADSGGYVADVQYSDGQRISNNPNSISSTPVKN